MSARLEHLGESGSQPGLYALQFRDGAFFVGTFDNCGRGSTWPAGASMTAIRQRLAFLARWAAYAITTKENGR